MADMINHLLYLCIYLQTCKGGLYRTNQSSALIFKTCIESVTSFYLSRCWQTELPWFCLNSAVRTVSFNPSHSTLCSAVTEVYFLPIYKFPKHPLVLLIPLPMCCHLFFSAEVWRATEFYSDAVKWQEQSYPDVARGTNLLDYSASVKARAFKNLFMLSSPLSKVNSFRWRQGK